MRRFDGRMAFVPEGRLKLDLGRYNLSLRDKTIRLSKRLAISEQVVDSTPLIIALIIAANADLPFVKTRDKDEIGRRENEGNGPPDGRKEKTVGV